MTRFTDSPYELFMTQVPAGGRPRLPPSGTQAIPAMAVRIAKARPVSGCATGI